jgi:hypothetical protein
MATIPANILQNITPSSLKQQGLARLSTLILNKGIQIKDQIEPQLTEKILNRLNSTVDNVCLPPDQLDPLIVLRNNIVDQLNVIGSSLDTAIRVVGITNNTLNTLLGIAAGIRAAKPAAIAAAATPVTGSPFASLVLNLNEILDKLKYDDLGNPKLQQIKAALDLSAPAISITAIFINQAINILNSIDSILKRCSPNSTITPANEGLVQISQQQEQASNTVNQEIYNGFVIRIEEIPFSPTVVRRKAVGINQSGIKLIETELSFTLNPEILINELKLIIDRDNLKAY